MQRSWRGKVSDSRRSAACRVAFASGFGHLRQKSRRTLSPQFGLGLFPKAPQAFPERLLYGLACYPEPALPPVGAEFFPVRALVSVTAPSPPVGAY